MRVIRETASLIFTVIGAIVIGLGAVMIGFGLLAPTDPPPSLNEGHAMAFVFGFVVAFIGIVGVAIGKAIAPSTVNIRARSVAAELAVAADERLLGPHGDR